MDLLMNGLLMAATLFAGGYCWVLARRVRDLKSLDKRPRRRRSSP